MYGLQKCSEQLQRNQSFIFIKIEFKYYFLNRFWVLYRFYNDYEYIVVRKYHLKKLLEII